MKIIGPKLELSVTKIDFGWSNLLVQN